MIVAGTGHRPPRLGGYSVELDTRLRRLAEVWLLAKQNEIEFAISGMALGWDQALARACVHLGCPFDAYVPFAGQEKVWPEESQRIYHWLLAKARNVVVCYEGEYEAWKLIGRDKRMVDAATDMLALFDGKEKGGTSTTVRYARSVNKPVHNLWGAYLELTQKS